MSSGFVICFSNAHSDAVFTAKKNDFKIHSSRAVFGRRFFFYCCWAVCYVLVSNFHVISLAYSFFRNYYDFFYFGEHYAQASIYYYDAIRSRCVFFNLSCILFFDGVVVATHFVNSYVFVYFFLLEKNEFIFST